MDNKFEVIIIGSGLSGLICANILSKKGYKVAILEKNSIPGGCLQTFKRKNVIFDTGIHYVGSFDEGQRLYKFYKYLGLIPGLRMRKLDEKGFDRFLIGEKEVTYASGINNFIETLTKSFPGERSAITNFANKVVEISKSIALYNLEPNDFSHSSFFEKINFGSTWEYITGITSNQELQQALSALFLLYGGSKEGSFLFVHSLIYNHYIDGAYRFIDGSAQITNLLLKELEKHGGKLFTCEDVDRFTFDDKKIKSVVTKNNNEFHTDHVISSIHPQNTMKMIEPGKIRKVYRRRIDNLKNTTSSFGLYLVFKKNRVPYMNHNRYIFPTGDVWEGSIYNPATWPLGCAVYPVADSRDETYTCGASVLTFMDFEEFKPWINTSVEARGNDYIDFKNQKAEKLIAFLRKYMPEVGNNIEHYYTSTPLTYRDYTGTPDGSIYGIERDYHRPLDSFIFPKTRIPNLLLTGQSTGLHGMLGVSIGALLTCAELVDLNEVLIEMNNV